ncbi:protein FAM246C-like [Bos indicus]|uniref:Protein FAM246C-like n=1 Tax=Bos indicus TaxID=9915 RepID=A0ABM4R487_BOSIN
MAARGRGSRRRRPGTPPRHCARPRPRSPGDSGLPEGQAYRAGGSGAPHLPQCAPRLSAAVPGLGGARARRRRLGSFCPRFCRRRGPAPRSAAFAAAAAAAAPAPAPARTSAASLSGARARGPRAGRAWSHPGAGAAAVLSTSGARCGQRRGRELRAPLYSPRPIQDPDSGSGDSRHLPVPPRGAAPSPHCSPPARRCRASSSPAA